MSASSQAEAIEQAARFLIDARYVMAMTGAGISVESGIPPFRGLVQGGCGPNTASRP